MFVRPYCRPDWSDAWDYAIDRVSVYGPAVCRDKNPNPETIGGDYNRKGGDSGCARENSQTFETCPNPGRGMDPSIWVWRSTTGS